MKIHSLNFQLQAMIISVTISSLVVMGAIFRITQQLSYDTNQLTLGSKLNTQIKEWDKEIINGARSRLKYLTIPHDIFMENFSNAIRRINRINGVIEDLHLDFKQPVKDTLRVLWELHREYQILSENITPNKLSKHNLELLSANLDGREKQIRNGLSELEDVLESIRSNRLAKMQETMNSSRKIMLFIMATFVIINIIIWLILKLRILAPLKILERGARSIGEGELGLQIDVNTKNEIRELVDVLNRMSLQLKDNQDTQAKLSKLETISQIVTSVNHEINNPLMIISGNAEFMLKVIGGDSEKIAKRLNAIIREVRRIFDVTQRLKEIKNPVVDKYVTEDTSMIDLKRSS